MNTSADMYLAYAVNSCCNDYESLELMINDAQPWARDDALDFERERFIAALEHAIDDGLIVAYELSTDPAQEVDYARDKVEELWYYVTAAGKEWLRQHPMCR